VRLLTCPLKLFVHEGTNKAYCTLTSPLQIYACLVGNTGHQRTGFEEQKGETQVYALVVIGTKEPVWGLCCRPV